MYKKLIISLLMCILLVFTLAPVTAMAAGSEQDGLKASLTTDKKSYNSDEAVSVNATVTNSNNFAVSDVNLELILPDGITVKSGDRNKTVNLAAGESVPITAVLSGTDGKVQTGDTSGTGIYIMLALVSVAAIILLLTRRKGSFARISNSRKSKTFARFLSVLLCLAMLVPLMPPAGNVLAESSNKTFSVSEPITVNGAAKIITLKVTYPSFNNTVSVTFQTNGGSEIKPVSLTRGGTLSDVPTPVKDNQAFTGWYTDQALTKEFYSDSPIISDMTLYAAYTERNNNLKQYEDPTKYIEDCASDVPFSIVSPIPLTKENLSVYVQLISYVGDIPELNVTGSDGTYKIAPATPYSAGGNYKFKLLNDSLHFSGESEAVRELTFRIHKDEVEKVALKKNIKYVLWKDVKTLENGSYTVPSDLYTIATGDTVCFWDGAVNDKTKLCNILLATAIQDDGQNSARTLLYTEESELSDVLDDVDVYIKNDVPTSEYFKNVDTKKIAEDAKNSEGTKKITAIIVKALSQSESVKKIEQSAGFSVVTDRDDQVGLNVDSFVKGLTVTATIGTAQNDNFYNDSFNFTVLTLSFDYSVVLKQTVEVKASFEIKEYIHTSMQGYKKWHGADLHFDYALNTYSQTNISLNVQIRSKDTSDEGYLDITEEIKNLTNGSEGDDADVAGILSEVLGSKGDDIDVVDVTLFRYSIPIIPEIPIFQVNFDLNFVVKVNFAAGISASSTIMEAKQVGICGSIDDGVSSYSNTLTGSDRYSFDFYCAGYVGFKTGLKLGISLSFFGLSDLGKVGVSGEVGAYADLYGFLHLNIQKYNQNGAVNTSLRGGLYMEAGLYIELDLFARSDVFKVKAEYTLFEIKIPLFSLGNRYVLYKFANNTNSLLINTESYSLSGSSGLLDAEYLDITTGEKVTGNYADTSNFYIHYSSPYFETEDQSIKVMKNRFGKGYTPMISTQTKRLDTTVYIYYTGNNLVFSNQQDGYAVRTLKLTWVDSSIDLKQYKDLNTVKATYVIDINGQKKVLAEKQVLFGEVPGEIDIWKYTRNGKITKTENNCNQAILKDTVYTYYLTTYQRLISFITYSGGEWHFDVYAVNAGEVPKVPEKYDSSGPDVTFTGWTGVQGWNFNVPEVNEVKALDFDTSKWGSNSVFIGLDTSKPLHSVSGSYQECYNAYFRDTYNGCRYSELSVYFYTAKYTSKNKSTVTFKFPSLKYTYNGNTFNLLANTVTAQFEFGRQVRCPVSYTYPGYDLVGWDSDGDGKADFVDYSDNDLPPANGDMTLTAVYKMKTYTVTVLDKDGNTAQKLTVNYGELPDIIKTSPAYPGGSDVYRFKNWLVSKSGGDFSKWNRTDDPGVYQDWTIKPAYVEYYTVTFDYGGGTYNSESKKTLTLEKGTYNVSDLINISPYKNKDVNNTYAFSGWDCTSLTLDGNKTVTAQYTPTSVMYTVTFTTSRGKLSNGGTEASFTGDYASYNKYITDFLAQNSQLETVYTTDKVYTFGAWDSTNTDEQHKNYVARWYYTDRNYNITFNSGEGSFGGGLKTDTRSLTYNSTGSFAGYTPTKPADVYTTFKLTGWKDQNGKVYSLTDTYTVTGDMTFTAVYEADQKILYTVTIDSGNGQFPDGTRVKTFTGYYNDATNIQLTDPVWNWTSADRYYKFSGWTSAIPTKFTENISISARYSEEYYDFTITFDAGSGAFEGGAKTVTQTYHYGNTVVMNRIPVKASDEYFNYTFRAWNPIVDTVTVDRTYTATYLATSKGTTLPETGIKVTDGETVEDINCNHIAGYNYSLHENGDGVFIPLLTVTGNGLTFEGSSSTVYILIQDNVTDVHFNNLELNGSYKYMDGPLYITYSESGISTKITVSGSCKLANTKIMYGTVRCERPTTFEGVDSESSLTIEGIAANVVYCDDGLTVNNLKLTVNVAIGNDPEFDSDGTAFGGESSDLVWRFTNSTVNVVSCGSAFNSMYAIEFDHSVFQSQCVGPVIMTGGHISVIDSVFNVIGEGGIGLFGGDVIIKGSSDIDVVSSRNDMNAIYIDEFESTPGFLRFEDFTGTFNASYQKSAPASAPLIYAKSGISFMVNGAEASILYDMGVSAITMLHNGDTVYYTFAVISGGTPTPVTSIEIKKKTLNG